MCVYNSAHTLLHCVPNKLKVIRSWCNNRQLQYDSIRLHLALLIQYASHTYRCLYLRSITILMNFFTSINIQLNIILTVYKRCTSLTFNNYIKYITTILHRLTYTQTYEDVWRNMMSKLQRWPAMCARTCLGTKRLM